MELPNKKKYSFPVILGMNSGEPLSTRIPRMRIYDSVLSQLDSSGAHYSQDLSEVDLSDPDDVKVLTNNPEGEVLIHLGSSNYLDRYKVYVGHVREWRQQFDRVESVDLRYDRQIIVNPDLNGAVKQPPLSRTAAKAAMAAGVKPAALTTRLTTSSTALVPRRVATPEKKRTVKAWHRKPSRKKTWVSKTGPSKKYPRTATQAARAARKPSPSIAKEQEHP